jgi:hypothetical protein
MTKPWKRRKYIKLNNDNTTYLSTINYNITHISKNNSNTTLVLPIKNRCNYNYLNFVQSSTIIDNTKLTLPIKNRRNYNYNYDNDSETLYQNFQKTSSQNDQETYCSHVSSPKLYMRDLSQNDLYFLEHYKHLGMYAKLRNQHVVENHYNTQKLVLWSQDF